MRNKVDQYKALNAGNIENISKFSNAVMVKFRLMSPVHGVAYMDVGKGREQER